MQSYKSSFWLRDVGIFPIVCSFSKFNLHVFQLQPKNIFGNVPQFLRKFRNLDCAISINFSTLFKIFTTVHFDSFRNSTVYRSLRAFFDRLRNLKN
jgi:hypothetical protein